MTTIIDGSAGITFPNGSNPQAAPCKVLQVVETSNTTQYSTSTTSFTASGLSVSITPLFSTSKILVLFNGSIYSATNGLVTLARNGSNILGSNGFYKVTAGANDYPSSFSYLDSPATTSATTYAIYYAAASANTIYMNINNTQCSLTVMEIAQ
jgi:hypothetical protein